MQSSEKLAAPGEIIDFRENGLISLEKKEANFKQKLKFEAKTGNLNLKTPTAKFQKGNFQGMRLGTYLKLAKADSFAV